MKRVRQLHLCLGVFFAPTILFFALTGSLQTFSLHEGGPSRSFESPEWLVRLAQVHKNQTLRIRRPARPSGADAATPAGLQAAPPAPAPPSGASPAPRRLGPVPLKIFVAIMALGLITTTILGLVMAFRMPRQRKVTWALLAAGTSLPIVLLFT